MSEERELSEKEYKKRAKAEIEALEAQIRDKQKMLEQKEAAQLGEHKIVYELEPIFRDVNKGGEPYTKVKKEFYPGEGKCIWCNWDARDAMDLVPYPGALSQQEYLIMTKALEDHAAAFYYPAKDKITGVEVQGHAGLMKVREVGKIPAGNNPQKIVAAYDGLRVTAADFNRKERERDDILKKQAAQGREIPVSG